MLEKYNIYFLILRDVCIFSLISPRHLKVFLLEKHRFYAFND
eukprot:UN19248